MICIDPGQAGGLVVDKLYLKEGAAFPSHIFSAISMPKTDREVHDWLADAKDPSGAGDVAYLEDLVKYTGRNMPSSAMAVYASNWGFIKGVLTALKYRIVLVPPKKWQAALGLGTTTGMNRTEWKNKLKQRAEQLFPNIKITLATADALLILEAARQGKLG